MNLFEDLKWRGLVKDISSPDLEEKLKVIIGTKVTIHQKTKDSGKIEIEYYSLDDLDRITDSIKLIQKN